MGWHSHCAGLPLVYVIGTFHQHGVLSLKPCLGVSVLKMFHWPSLHNPFSWWSVLPVLPWPCVSCSGPRSGSAVVSWPLTLTVLDNFSLPVKNKLLSPFNIPQSMRNETRPSGLFWYHLDLRSGSGYVAEIVTLDPNCSWQVHTSGLYGKTAFKTIRFKFLPLKSSGPCILYFNDILLNTNLLNQVLRNDFE